MLVVLKQAKESDKEEDKDLFATLITIIIEECKYHDTYPEKELAITGKLYGSIIREGYFLLFFSFFLYYLIYIKQANLGLTFGNFIEDYCGVY